ncbi:Vaculolar membrane protein [Geosmithia morbida]|uniref:Vaculolar membrane protein n=1 Tax=Geosmithia morbida TaxID=1094350 RepID=A0A9P4YUQ3_9HYPO|nr:Vaculolar membrane protein [Geosmithia morbida]KAF4123456.1 Vaculolar membrane protein [Geosmithia morbida]
MDSLASFIVRSAVAMTAPPPPSMGHPHPPPDAPPGDGGGGGPPVGPPGSQGDCRLMGPFSLFVQAALGSLALLSLVFKRWRERPQRPVKIWFFDASKQVFGSVLVHIANIFMSMLTSGRFAIKMDPRSAGDELMARREDGYVPNPCSFYILNLAIDTTVGIPILIILLKITTGLVARTPFGTPRESIQSGYYGQPPSAWWWLKQSLIYFVGLFGMKVCVLIIFLVLPWISEIGDWALSWTEGNERLQIAFVMMIFPLIMNAMQYYIIDSFIKEPGSADHHERLPTEDPDESDSGDRRHHHHRNRDDDEADRGEELVTSSDNDDPDDDNGDGQDSDDDKRMKKKGQGNQRANNDSQKRRGSSAEYDPAKDGDAGTVIGSVGTSSLTKS